MVNVDVQVEVRGERDRIPAEEVMAASVDETCHQALVGGAQAGLQRQQPRRCEVRVLDGARLPTVAFHRMGDMGKLPTSAWLRLWKDGGVRELLANVCRQETVPTKRAALLVKRFAEIHRVGRKLATMFVSALSTPALAPGLTPWFPDVDGNALVVVDTNVARAVDALRKPAAPKSYDAREAWVREQAALLDLRSFSPALPRYSPRLLQEAFYAFCSRSNRIERGDLCATRSTPCPGCAPRICPFAISMERNQVIRRG